MFKALEEVKLDDSYPGPQKKTIGKDLSLVAVSNKVKPTTAEIKKLAKDVYESKKDSGYKPSGKEKDKYKKDDICCKEECAQAFSCHCGQCDDKGFCCERKCENAGRCCCEACEKEYMREAKNCKEKAACCCKKCEEQHCECRLAADNELRCELAKACAYFEKIIEKWNCARKECDGQFACCLEKCKKAECHCLESAKAERAHCLEKCKCATEICLRECKHDDVCHCNELPDCDRNPQFCCYCED